MPVCKGPSMYLLTNSENFLPGIIECNTISHCPKDNTSTQRIELQFTRNVSKILLLEFSFPSVRPFVRSSPFLTCIVQTCIVHYTYTCTMLSSSHGLSARRARRTKSSRPEGPQTGSWGPEGP